MTSIFDTKLSAQEERVLELILAEYPDITLMQQHSIFLVVMISAEQAKGRLEHIGVRDLHITAKVMLNHNAQPLSGFLTLAEQAGTILERMQEQ